MVLMPFLFLRIFHLVLYAIFKNCALLIWISSLQNSYSVVAQRSSNLRLFSFNNLSNSSQSDIKNASLDEFEPIQLTPMDNFAPVDNPLVTISLPFVMNISNYSALLSIFSFGDSLPSANFVVEIKSAVRTSPSKTRVILYGLAGVFFTNLCAIGGLIFLPIIRRRFYGSVLTFMTSMAVGALISTSLLVLVPEGLRMSDMPSEFGGDEKKYLLKMASILAGSLFFFCLEYLLFFIKKRMEKGERSGAETSAVSQFSNEHGHAHEFFTPAVALAADAFPEFEFSEKPSISSCSSYDNRISCLTKSRTKCTDIASVAWMILLGDGCHNLMDGLTIGVGFSKSISIGITLSITIFCEELPHELGDFAILTSSGMSIKSALISNFLSSSTAYVGLFIGIAIGEVSVGALYVFAVTAGIFLYISLSVMLPTLKERIFESEKRTGHSFRIFMIEVLGMLFGFTCVLSATLLGEFVQF